jgi:hypothetical protein
MIMSPSSSEFLKFIVGFFTVITFLVIGPVLFDAFVAVNLVFFVARLAGMFCLKMR